MRFPWLILVFIFIPFITLAQSGIITGKITQEGSSKPIPRASVFLSNSSVGSASTEDGTFTLSGVREGQYTLVVTVLGYEDYSKTILVGREPIKLSIQMVQKPMMLKEVVISSEADWRKNYEAFRKEFIGTDENAKYCTVMNPHILSLTYNPTKQLLHAEADEFLIVENRALGYRVKFLLNDFKIDKISNIISREGQQVFEELPGTAAQKKRWHQKREEAYYGSAMHFYRSLYTDKLKEEGFIMYHFNRYLNPIRPPDDIIRRKFKMFNEMRRPDSAKYYLELANMSKYYHESLIQPPLQQFEVMTMTGQQGLYAIHFTSYLYVAYTKKTDDVFNKDLYRPLDQPNYSVSVITLGAPFAVFDMNGIIVENAPLYEGAWARDRLSDMLPVDYVPDQK
jgi:CarboxypepD_reg-like domain